MEYRLARSYEEQGYKIMHATIEEENGKLYADAQAPCSKCSGRGRIAYFAHIDSGVCFLCGGCGYFIKNHCRIYTETEREKMDAAAERRREKKLEEAKAQAQAKIQAWKDKYNISDGNIFVVAGCNTFDIKDELKADGAKFYTGLGWFFGTATAPAESKYPEGTFLFRIEFDSLLYFTELGNGPYFKEGALDEMKANITDVIKSKNKETSASKHIGNIGDRLKKVDATFIEVKSISGDWGSSLLYTFKIGEDVATWFTQAGIDSSIEPGDKIILSGTVKNHTEYNGVLQTQLNRCIVKRGE